MGSTPAAAATYLVGPQNAVAACAVAGDVQAGAGGAADVSCAQIAVGRARRPRGCIGAVGSAASLRMHEDAVRRSLSGAFDGLGRRYKGAHTVTSPPRSHSSATPRSSSTWTTPSPHTATPCSVLHEERPVLSTRTPACATVGCAGGRVRCWHCGPVQPGSQRQLPSTGWHVPCLVHSHTFEQLVPQVPAGQAIGEPHTRGQRTRAGLDPHHSLWAPLTYRRRWWGHRGCCRRGTRHTRSYRGC